MLNLKKVAVTGGLSSGKSSVCRIFKELGAHVVSSDEIVHQLLTPETFLGQQVIKLLGNEIEVEGRLDRSKIAYRVFNDPPLLKALESILHPAVREEVDKIYQNVRNSRLASLFVVEIPLLYEAGFANYDAVIAVVADSKLCKQRYAQSTGRGPEEFDQRMSRQIPQEEKARRAQFVIRNEGSLDGLREAVIAIYNQLI